MAEKIIKASNGVAEPVYISFKDKEIQAKSILGILALEVGKGDSIVIKTSCQNVKDLQIQMKKLLTD